MSFVEFLLDLVFPKVCLGCGRGGMYVCEKCYATIRFYTHPLCPGCFEEVKEVGIHRGCREKSDLDGLYAVARHEGVIRTLIHRAKYADEFDVLKVAARYMSERMPKEMREANLLVPIPLHQRRRKERGYNQSEILVSEISKNERIPHSFRLLSKTKATESQMKLSREKRLTNIMGGFEVVRLGSGREDKAIQRIMKEGVIVLVDDVSTTGATLKAAARALKQAGARWVYGLVLAHGK